jgi:hypothetical protein
MPWVPAYDHNYSSSLYYLTVFTYAFNRTTNLHANLAPLGLNNEQLTLNNEIRKQLVESPMHFVCIGGNLNNQALAENCRENGNLKTIEKSENHREI